VKALIEKLACDRFYESSYLRNDWRAGVSLCNLRFHNHAPGGSCLAWRGDPSSLVIDCNLLNIGGSPDPSINIEEDGG
jgi:hypothetical protein